MTKTRPIHALRAGLEDKRLDAVQTRAASGTALESSTLAERAQLQLALTALREEIEAHSVQPGWGSAEALK